MTLELRFPVSLAAPGAARRCLDELSPHVDSETLEDVRLLVSELVTNSVRHSGLAGDHWIGLDIETNDSLLRVEVTDPGAELGKTLRPMPMPESSGWGLHIVNQVADRWGAFWDGINHFWFEIDIPRATELSNASGV